MLSKLKRGIEERWLEIDRLFSKIEERGDRIDKLLKDLKDSTERIPLPRTNHRLKMIDGKLVIVYDNQK